MLKISEITTDITKPVVINKEDTPAVNIPQENRQPAENGIDITKPINQRQPEATTLNNTTKEISNKHNRPATRNADSHSFSQDVFKMQDKMLYLANTIRTSLADLLPTSDKNTYNEKSAFLLDPTILEKINIISPKKNDKGSTYADGLWGQRTQDALNALYSYAQIIAAIISPNDRTLNGLMTEFEKYAGDNKRYTDIKDYQDAAKSVYNILDKLDDETIRFSQYIKQNPDALKQRAELGFAVPSDGYATKEDMQKEQTVSDILAKSGGLILPFDTATDTIYFERFKQFLDQVYRLITNKNFSYSMSDKIPALTASYTKASNDFANWTNIPNNIKGKEGGFNISANLNYHSFINDYANGDYKQAFSMLNILSSIVVDLTSIMTMLSDSRDLSPAKSEITNQELAGNNYIKRISNMISQINYDTKRK